MLASGMEYGLRFLHGFTKAFVTFELAKQRETSGWGGFWAVHAGKCEHCLFM